MDDEAEDMLTPRCAVPDHGQEDSIANPGSGNNGLPMDEDDVEADNNDVQDFRLLAQVL